MYEIIHVIISQKLYNEVLNLKKSLHYNWDFTFDYLLTKHQPLDDVPYGYNEEYKSKEKQIFHIQVSSRIWVKWRKFTAPFKNQAHALDYILNLEKSSFSNLSSVII